jgi:hypothetical protein
MTPEDIEGRVAELMLVRCPTTGRLVGDLNLSHSREQPASRPMVGHQF